MRHLLLFVLLTFSYTASAQTYEGPQTDIDAILVKAKTFSQYFVDGEMDKIVGIYTEDAKLFPTGKDIMSGTEALASYWTRSPDVKALHHKLTPLEIIVCGDRATDYGYYEGQTQYKDQPVSSWKGKYVVVWQKENGEWKMDLDIWNRIDTPTTPTVDQVAVRAACQDYINSFYKADTTLAYRSIHPSLRKVGYYYNEADGQYSSQLEMPFRDLISLASEWNIAGDKTDATSPQSINLFEVSDKTATAKVTAVWGIDYLSLAKVDGKWMIMNVLWQSAPR